jgi:hypothetical protein
LTGLAVAGTASLVSELGVVVVKSPPRRRHAGAISAALLALLHQQALGGARCRPLELSAFGEAHRAGWLAGWGAPT